MEGPNIASPNPALRIEELLKLSELRLLWAIMSRWAETVA
jgi:hypothetical protein